MAPLGFDSCFGCERVLALMAGAQSLGDCQGALEHGARLPWNLCYLSVHVQMCV